jgi:hypothetical protein
MEHRRSWTVELPERRMRIEVIYRALFGWVSIEVDGRQQARAWREFQTVFGGATLACDVKGHRIEARVTQPFSRQEYAFALRVDGELQPGSDPQPEPSSLRRQTLIAIAGVAVTALLIAFVLQVVRQL